MPRQLTATKPTKPTSGQTRRLYPKTIPVVARFMSARKLADVLGVSMQTARRFILREGIGRKIGGRYRVVVRKMLRDNADIVETLMFLDE